MKIIKYMVCSLLLSATLALSAQDSIAVKSEEGAVNLAYRSIDKQRLVGAVDVISSEELLHTTHYKASNALPGLASGLYVAKGSADPGETWTTMKVRGLSRGGNSDAPLIVVDGIPNRSIDNLPIDAIETITVIKDVTAKMLYGSQAANGVILVNTKRGHVGPRKISFSVEGGVKMPTFKPDYLDAPTYASLYNQAQINDGTKPEDVLYSQDDIQAYRDGTNPLSYPDEDYYDTFVKDYSDYQKVSASLIGADELKKYFLILDYLHEGGLEKVGNDHDFNQLNLLSNLDYKVNDVISATLDMSVRLGFHSKSNVRGSNLYTSMGTHRPNDYPFFATQDQTVNTDSLAYNSKGGFNLYGNQTRAGYQIGQDFQAQTAMSLNFNLDDYVRGLSAQVKFGFDNYNSIYKGKWLGYATYKIDGDSLTRIGEDEIKNTEQRFYDNFSRNFSAYGTINYDRTFGDHAILGDFSFQNRKYAYKTTINSGELQQDDTGINIGLRANYVFQNKYIFQLNSSYMGTDRLQSGQRFNLYAAAGAAWVLSEEDFLKESSTINFLKLKASYGTMGYDKPLDYFLYMDEYSFYSGYYTGTNNSLYSQGERISQIGNPNLTLETSTEFNAGVESRFLNNTLSFEANYFLELREGMPVAAKSRYPGYVANVAATINYNSVKNQGVDMSINYNNNAGDLFYSIGAKMMYTKAVYEAYDELVDYDHLRHEGQVTDNYFGLLAEGLYPDQAAIDAHGVTSAYGIIRPGDIRYENYINDTGDEVIDQYDIQNIGHTYPRVNYSFNLNLAYKGFELYALGQGVADVDKMLTSSYFLNYGEGKYSTEVLANNYPSLTTNTSAHSFIPSSYWMQNGAYFKLRTAELSYTLPAKASERVSAEKVKLYLQGTDLLTLSSIKSVDPEDVDAGVSKYPLFTTVVLGAKITF